MSYIQSYDDFVAQFTPYQLPELLQQLFALEQQDPDSVLSDGFYLRCMDKSGLQSYSSAPVFVNSFIEFANANYTGSTYAYWLITEDLAQCPIVAFGDEGGIRVVARDLPELLHLLTFDTEPIVAWDWAFYYTDEAALPGRKHSERYPEYRSWVKEHLQLDPITTNEAADNITVAAREKYQTRLDDFLRLNGIEID